MTKLRPTLALACLGMATFGIILSVLGASLPGMIDRFRLDRTQAGALISLMSFWILAGSVVFGPIIDRRGYRGMLVVVFAGIIVGLIAIAVAPSLNWLRTGIAVVGFTGGMLNGAVNSLVSDVSSEDRGAALTFAGGFAGVGAAIVPMAFSTLAGSYSQGAILTAIAAMVALPLALAATVELPPPKQPHAFPAAETRRLLSDPVLYMMGLILFLESGLESTLGGWTPTFFDESLRVPAARAPIYLALFWVGLTLTRWVLGSVMRPGAGARVLLASLSLALVSSLLLVATRNVALAAGSIFALGCGLAAVFPVVYGFVADRYAQLSGTALGIVIVIALIGGTVLPYVVGVIATGRTLRTAFLLVPVAVILSASVVHAISRHVRTS